MSILDQFGRSIPASEIRRLREPAAAPTLAGVRPVISGYPAEGMTPARLADIHRAAAEGDSLRYLELAEDIEERDLHYAGVLGTRKRAVAQLPIAVVAVSDDKRHQEHKDLVQRWVDSGVLEMALFDILDAVGKGFSVTEVEWATDGGWIRPGRLIYRLPRWFEASREDGDTILLRESATLQPLAPHKFLVHRHPSKSGLVMRSGLARLASWAWMLKAYTARDWAMFVQSYGQPVRIGRYGPEASQEDRDVLWSAVANIAGDCAAIIPRSMDIEFVQTGDLKANGELYQQRCEYLERLISKAVLGQTATTDAISGGHAVGREHRLVQEDIERSDARLVSVSVSRQLVQSLVAFNFGPQDAYPQIRIGRPDEVPLSVVVDAVHKLVPLGLQVEASELRDRLGLSEPGKLADGTPNPDVEVLRRGPGEPHRPPLALPPPQQPPAELPRLARHLVSRHVTQPDPDLVGQLTDRLALDAQGALAGLTDQIREVLQSAESYAELQARLAALQLEPREMALAMTRAFAVAHLTGQAAVLDELGLAPGGAGRAP